MDSYDAIKKGQKPKINPKEFDNHEEYNLAIDFAKKHNIKVEERIEI